MSEPATEREGRRVGLEIPIEPLPTGPLVPRTPPAEELLPVTIEDTQPVANGVADEPAPSTVTAPDRAPEPERDDAGGSALRPAAPPPAIRSRGTSSRPPRFTDRRHPFRASLGLLVLVVVASIALAATIGAAVAFVALAVRQAVS